MDVIVIGDGPAGWETCRRLRADGVEAFVVGRRCGFSQARHAQGILHSGLKHALRGETDLDDLIASADDWAAEECVSDTVAVLSPIELSRELLARWGGRSTRRDGGVEYFFDEKVVDVRDYLRSIRREEWLLDDVDVSPELDRDGGLRAVYCGDRRETPRFVVLAAGLGNQDLTRRFMPNETLDVRERPVAALYMEDARLPWFHGHLLDDEGRVAVTITSREPERGRVGWSIGGDVCETTDLGKAWDRALRVIRRWFWLSAETLSRIQSRATVVPRAECWLEGRRRMRPVVRRSGRVVAVWPTKLSLVRAAAKRVAAIVSSDAKSEVA